MSEASAVAFEGFPAERDAKRRVLLDAVASIEDVLAAHRDDNEELRTLEVRNWLCSLGPPGSRRASGGSGG